MESFDSIPPDVQRLLSSTTFGSDLGTYLVTLGGHNPDISALLLRKDSDFWCTERIFTEPSRLLHWNECVWQLQLETRGTLNSINTLGQNASRFKENRTSMSEVCVRGIFLRIKLKIVISTGDNSSTVSCKIES